MSDTIEIIPTVVPHSRDSFVAATQIAAQFTPRIHFDVDDGIFTHEVSWPFTKMGQIGPFDFAAIAPVAVDVHLMVEEPQKIIAHFIDAGAKRIIVHFETYPDKSAIFGSITECRSRGVEIGLALLIDTPIEVLAPFASKLDFVHLMTIAAIGRQGIRYDSRGADRVRAVHHNFPELMIQVDGGVNDTNIAELVRAGARRFGVGAAIMLQDDPRGSYQVIQSVAESALGSQ